MRYYPELIDAESCDIQNITLQPNMRLHIQGQCNTQKYPSVSHLKYDAAAPPDYRLSYAGSALPYPNPEIAYSNGVEGTIPLHKDGTFQLQVWYPNAYYVNQGTKLISPHVHLKLLDEGMNILATYIVQLDPVIQNRTLTNQYCKPNRVTYR